MKMFKNEIAVSDKESAMKIANILVDEEYCVMLSREEDLYIINFEYSEFSDRNNVVFMDREDFEQRFKEIIKE